MYNCKIYHPASRQGGISNGTYGNDELILLDINVLTLKDLAKELDMTYQQVADLSSRKQKKNYLKFKFSPKVEITKIPKNK